MEVQNSKSEFVTNLSKLGYPVWDKCPTIYSAPALNSFGGGGGSDTLVYIPFIDEDSTCVTSFLACLVKTDSIKMKLFNSFKYSDYGFDVNSDVNELTAETIASITMYLETFALPSHDTFRINDFRLYNISGWTHSTLDDSTKYLIIDNNPDDDDDDFNNILIATTTTLCWSNQITTSPDVGRNNSANFIVLGPQCMTITIWSELIMNTPDVIWPSSGGGTGSGSFQQINCSNFPSPECLQSPGHGWSHYTADPSDYDPARVDSIEISNGLRNVFPCMTSLIKDSLKISEYISNIAGQNLFSEEIYTDLVFDTSTTLNANSTVMAETVPILDSVVVDAYGRIHFKAIVQFNPYFLRTAPKEIKLAVALHETMHAVFKLRFVQYKVWLNGGGGTIDSNYMKLHYPIYWAAISQNPNHWPTQVSEHEMMATKYRNQFISHLKPHYNKNAPRQIRDTVIAAFSFLGLKDTKAWGLLSSKGVDTCKYNTINACAQYALSATFHVPNCPTYTLSYTDSLKLTPGCK